MHVYVCVCMLLSKHYNAFQTITCMHTALADVTGVTRMHTLAPTCYERDRARVLRVRDEPPPIETPVK